MLRWLIPLVFGPLYFEGNGAPGAGAGAGDAGSGAAGSGGSGSSSGGSTSSSGDDAGKGKAGSSDDAGGVMIPKARFDEVNGELQRLRKAEEKRVADDLRAKGEHAALADVEKAGREKAERALKRTALESAFVKAAAGKVVDIDAAYRLADFAGIEVEIQGEGDDSRATLKGGDVGKIVEDLVKRYPFLAPGARTTGGGMGGPVNGAGNNPPDISKLSTDEKLRVGLEQEIAKLTPQRQGLLGRTE